jgi:predicted amidohydrolase YtcJ
MKILFTLSLLLLFSCLKKEPVDMILVNGNIITLSPQTPKAEAIVIKKDRILFVGKNSELKRFNIANAEIIDLKGKTVIPGFIDAHAHLLSLGNSLKNISLSKITAWDDAVSLVENAVKKSQPGDWITGRGWHQEKWESAPKPNIKGFPTHKTVSKISQDNPIILKHASGHAIFVNAKAMQIAGINSKTKSPAGGEIIKDKNGQPTGILLETAMDLVYTPYQKYLEGLSAEEQKRISTTELEAAMQHSLQNGVTTFSDAGAFFSEIDLFKEFAENGKLDIRLWVMVSSEETLSDALLQKYKMIGFGDNHLTVRAIKQYADGALGSRGAWMLEPYSDMPSTSGFNVTPLDSIRRTAGFAYKNGYQLCTHSIGDRANREMLDIYQDVLNGDTSRRWRIEHAQHLSLEDIGRFAPLGIIASMQTVHCTSDGPWVPTRIGNKRAEEGAYVWQKLLQNGTHFANGTDCPVERLSPIENFYSAVTRRLPDSSQFYPKQVLSREEALKSLTIWNAYAGFEEDIKGSIEVGKLADFVVLSQDILTVPENEILKTKVFSTIVGGEVKYEDRD